MKKLTVELATQEAEAIARNLKLRLGQGSVTRSSVASTFGLLVRVKWAESGGIINANEGKRIKRVCLENIIGVK